MGKLMMNIGREPTEDADDAAPVEMLAQLFEAHGWPCEFVNDDEICGEIQGSWATYQVRGIWRSEDNVLQLLCLPEIRVPDAKRKAAYELLALVNEQLWLGHFDIWSNGGVLLYRAPPRCPAASPSSRAGSCRAFRSSQVLPWCEFILLRENRPADRRRPDRRSPES